MKMTRKQKARELLFRIEAGPASLDDHTGLQDNYKLWAKTWIIPRCKELIRELKGSK